MLQIRSLKPEIENPQLNPGQTGSRKPEDQVRNALPGQNLTLEKTNISAQANGKDFFTRQPPAGFSSFFLPIDSLIADLSKNVSLQQLEPEIRSILESLAGSSAATDPALIRDIDLILQKDAGTSAESVMQLKNLLIQLRQAVSNAVAAVQPKYIELPVNNIPESIYTFDAAAGLLSSLKLPQKFVDVNCQYIRIIPFGDKSLAELIGSDDLRQELRSLAGNFSSNLMQSLPPAALETVIKSRNCLDLELLKTTDTLLSGIQTGFSFRRTGPEPAGHPALTQWLLTLNDHKSILNELVIRYPATATSLVSLTRELPFPLPPSGYFGITEELFETVNNKADIIPSAFERLGYDFEHRLLEAGYDQTKQVSLKKAILDNLSSLQPENSLPPAPGTVISSSHADEITQDKPALSGIIDAAYKKISGILSDLPGPFESDTDLKNYAQPLRDALSRISEMKKGFDADLQSDRNILINATGKNGNESKLPLNPGNGVTDLLPKIINDIRIFQNTLLNVKNEISTAILEYLIKSGNDLIKSMEEPITPQEDSLSGGKNQEPKISNENKPAGDHDQQTSRTSSEKTAFREALLLNQSSRPVLDSLLNRLESLQLLSRITQTSEGTQQILALPVNVGGEWTEVNIRLVKKENLSRKNTRKMYKVQMDVAPSRLGAISVRMDYEPKKRFDLKIYFDREQTLDWFSKNRDSLGRSLSVLGLPPANFQMRSGIRKKQENGETGSFNALIDVKI